MTGRARRGKPRGTVHPNDDATDGTARYMWAFVQNKAVVLSIPGLRDLELSADDARTIGEMLIERADEADNCSPRDSRQTTSELEH